MSAFMRSTQATNSPSSVGRVGSRIRWMETPPATSSGGDSSPPRVRTWTSMPSSTSASESLRTWRASPPSISGGYSQERIRTRGIPRPRSVLTGGGHSRLPQGGEAEIWCQAAHTGVRRLAGVYGLEQGPRVGGGALVRIVARLPATVEERPVARLERQQLARRPLGGLAPELPGSDRGHQAQLQAPPRPGEVGDLRRVPRVEILPLTPGGLVEYALLGLVALEGLGERHEANAPCDRVAKHALEPCRALRPPMAEELGVDCEGHQAGSSMPLAEGREALRDRGAELARVG